MQKQLWDFKSQSDFNWMGFNVSILVSGELYFSKSLNIKNNESDIGGYMKFRELPQKWKNDSELIGERIEIPKRRKNRNCKGKSLCCRIQLR